MGGRRERPIEDLCRDQAGESEAGNEQCIAGDRGLEDQEPRDRRRLNGVSDEPPPPVGRPAGDPVGGHDRGDDGYGIEPRQAMGVTHLVGDDDRDGEQGRGREQQIEEGGRLAADEAHDEGEEPHEQ